MLVSGASKVAYWTANYIVDVLYHAIPCAVARLCIHRFEIDAPESEVVFAVFSLTNPVFIYALSFFFESELTASVLIRVGYFVLGGLAPIAMQVLQVINHRCI